MPSTQQSIIHSLRHQTLRIPPLSSLFRSWPSPKLNKSYPFLIPVVNAAILKAAARQPDLEVRLGDDIALLTCAMYPSAERPQLDALALLLVWIICWDDTVDASEGDLAEDFEGAERERERILGLGRVALGVGSDGDGGDGDDGEASRTLGEGGEGIDPLDEILLDAGRRIAQNSSLPRRWLLFRQLSKYIQGCSTEQRTRLAGVMPTYTEYMSFREGTIGAGLFCALIPYALNLSLDLDLNLNPRHSLPSSIVDSPHVGVLTDQVIILYSLINDLLSLKKELRTDCVLNAVAALLPTEGTLDEAVDEVVLKMREAVRMFDAAAAQLANTAGEDPELRTLTQSFIDEHRAIVTGLIEFMLKSPRYNISQLLRKDGSLEIVL